MNLLTEEEKITFEKIKKDWKNSSSLLMNSKYFDLLAKSQGFENHEKWVNWAVKDGPWKPSNRLYYLKNVKYKNKN